MRTSRFTAAELTMMGRKIRKLRQEQGLTQSDLAKRAGIQHQHGGAMVSKLERGAHTYPTAAKQCLDYLEGEVAKHTPVSTNSRVEAEDAASRILLEAAATWEDRNGQRQLVKAWDKLFG